MTVAGGPSELGWVDSAEAARRLGVDESRIEVLVREGMLHPLEPRGAEDRFEIGEVEALRLEGG